MDPLDVLQIQILERSCKGLLTREVARIRIIELPDADLCIRAYGFLGFPGLKIFIETQHGNRPNTLPKYRNLRSRRRGQDDNN